MTHLVGSMRDCLVMLCIMGAVFGVLAGKKTLLPYGEEGRGTG